MVAAFHEAVAVLHKPYSAISDVVAFPLAAADTRYGEQHLGDLAIAGLGKPAVQRAQGEDQSAAPRRAQRPRIRARLPSAQSSPEAQGGREANVE